MDLVHLIEHHLGPGVGRGRGRKWNCPFHDDRTPSFGVTPDGRHWKCFGCGRSGRAEDLLERFGARPRARSGPPVRAREGRRRRRAPLPVVAAWQRALERGACALSEQGVAGCDALQYLARRLGPDGSEDAERAVELLVRELEVGLLDETEPVPWLRQQAAGRYRLVLPLWVVGPREPAVDIVDLALRHIGPGDPPGPKLLRTPGACPGACVSYGNLPGALTAADGNKLIVTEGWADYLVMRAGGRCPAVVGLFSASTAGGFGDALVGELMVLRHEGVAGPREIVFVCQAGEAANARAYDRIQTGLTASGITMRIMEFDPSGCWADP